MTPAEYELLLQQERQRSKELEQQVRELTAALEELREEQKQSQIKMKLEANLHTNERHNCREHRRQPASARQRPIGLKRSAQLKLTKPKIGKCTVRAQCKSVMKILPVPEIMRQEIQRQLQEEHQLYRSVIENQKTAAATEEATRALHANLHISEPNNAPVFSQFQDYQLLAESTDLDKKKLMQHRLKCYVHTQTCRALDDDEAADAGGEPWHCGQSVCATMKKVLAHMNTCTDGIDCGVPLCSSTREVIEHWKSCVNDECSICRHAKESLKEHTEILASTLEILNEGMGIASSVANLSYY